MSDIRKQLSKIQREIEDAVKTTTGPRMMMRLGNEAIKRIQTRTRLGRGVAYGSGERPKSTPLKPLSEAYREYRTRVRKADGQRKKRISLSPLTSPGKSNLTFTGQMLSNIKLIEAKQGYFELGIVGEREDGLTNEEVAEFVAKGGREFFDLTEPEVEGLRAIIRLDLTKRVAKI